MAIKDPPDYVAIDPCLIYGDTDLPPETHLRLLQLVGWMWVTKRSGKPLGVKIEELAERWGISQRTAYHTLQSLGAQGYLNIHYSRGWTYLERGPMITGEQPQAARGDEHTPGEPAHTGRERRQPNRPREAATQQAARGGEHTPGEPATDNIHNPGATPLHETGENAPSRATPLHTANTSIVDGVDLTDPSLKHHQQTNTINAAVQQACTEAGFWEDVALELAGDPWVTPERVGRTVDDLQARKDRGELVSGRPIGNVPALAAANLRRHQEPPAPVKPAERIALTCPRCYSYPCMCDDEGRPPWEQPGAEERWGDECQEWQANAEQGRAAWDREKQERLGLRDQPGKEPDHA
jgi:hypothetical protein